MRQFAILLLLLVVRLAFAADQSKNPDPSQKSTWYFAVAGDSRNCGDVVMPAIAAGAAHEHAAFYWHLGDLRKISGPDQDFMKLAALEGKTPTREDYLREAWKDFKENQMSKFGSMEFFLGIGNHETTPPKTRADFIAEFRNELDIPEIKNQRLKEDATDDRVRTYYHWVRDGVDFINLDNATQSEFEGEELKWFERLVSRDAADTSIYAVVAGMHEPLAESISFGHSMNETPAGTESGRRAYLALLKLQNESHKHVYILASHSHYYMDGIFNTQYWRTHGGVLPGWIIGTAGAERYPLPAAASDANGAKTNVYGYLLATVSGGEVKFEFKEIDENQIPSDVVQRFTKPFVDECFNGNRRAIGF